MMCRDEKQEDVKRGEGRTGRRTGGGELGLERGSKSETTVEQNDRALKLYTDESLFISQNENAISSPHRYRQQHH